MLRRHRSLTAGRIRARRASGEGANGAARARREPEAPPETHGNAQARARGRAARHIPLATYRCQFNRRFTFRQAMELADYWRELGISDCYASPLFQARPESEHGYDACSFEQLNPNLGGMAAFNRFAARLRSRGLGLLLDVVPNHMAASPLNPWWSDVLEKGASSRYARWFDIDWDTPDPALQDKVLLPVLEDHYAAVLESGKLRLVFENGSFAMAYYSVRFPLSPESQAGLKGAARSKPHIKRTLRGLNGTAGKPGSFNRLDELLEEQHYRLAYWRAGPGMLNYRRFFDISSLAALQMEEPEVFQASHRLIFQLLREGKIRGLRVDHPDGLLKPKQYFERVQAGWSRNRTGSRADRSRSSVFVVAEKILSGDEPLPSDWPVDGTTGYDFLNRVNGVFVDSANQSAFDKLYRGFTGCDISFSELVYQCKRKVLRNAFDADLAALTRALRGIAASSRYGADFTWRELHGALCEIISSFPVYRTFADEQSSVLRPAERDCVAQAVQDAARHNSGLDRRVLGFIEDLLQLRPARATGATGTAPAPGAAFGALAKRLPEPPGLKPRRDFVLRFQQLTGPVMAKGFEDTALYNYNRLISLNEVGGNPEIFGSGVDAFHRHNFRQARHWPHTLLATATHDTKRGEDARARINVLSEMPEQWAAAARRWARLNAPKKSRAGIQPAPHPNDEYLLYQAMIGSWPWPGKLPGINSEDLAGFRQRLSAFMLKALREAKARTSWTNPDCAYEAAMARFIEALLDSSKSRAFLNDFVPFQKRVAFFGQFNSLSQILLKLTSPGVPDFYQGTELWDFSFVDPDNRREVDFALRRRLLAELKKKAAEHAANPGPFLAGLLRDWTTGSIKLYLIWRALEFRQRNRIFFESGDYLPLAAQGRKKAHVCAFVRRWNGRNILVVAPRLTAGLAASSERAPLGSAVWGDTALELPAHSAGCYRNALIGGLISARRCGKSLMLAEILACFPVALLEEALDQ